MKNPFARSMMFIGVLMAAFTIGRMTAPIPTQHVQAPVQRVRQPRQSPVVDWDTISAVIVDSAKDAPTKKDHTETILRAHYLDRMRDQSLQYRQQSIDAELEARRILNDRVRAERENRINIYNEERYCRHGKLRWICLICGE